MPYISAIYRQPILVSTATKAPDNDRLDFLRFPRRMWFYIGRREIRVKIVREQQKVD